MRKRVADVGVILGLTGAYILAARFGLSLDAAAGFATLVWPPTGVSLAALLLLGRRFWPAVFIGAVISNLLSGAPVLVALGIGCGNTCEALIAVTLLGRVSKFDVTLETVRDVLLLFLFAALVSTLVS